MHSTGIARILVLALVSTFLSSPGRGQAFSLFSADAFSAETGGRQLDLGVASLHGPFSIRTQMNLSPKQAPALDREDLERIVWLPYEPPGETTGGSAYRGLADRVSCVVPCDPLLPFQEAPIDADRILARCDKGFWSLITGSLRALSLGANEIR